ncbi:MAG: type II secretion system protein GspM [Acidiferrobacter sp.]
MNLWRQGVAALATQWRTRSAPQRQMIARAAMVLLPLLFYLLVWAPLHDRVDYLQHAVPRAHRRVALMRREAQQVQKLQRYVGQAPTGTALLSAIEQEAQTAMISAMLTQLSPRGQYKAQAVFSGVPFNALVRFLADLRGHGVAVRRVELTPAAVGRVSGAVTLGVAR